jgi:hypothetical protein
MQQVFLASNDSKNTQHILSTFVSVSASAFEANHGKQMFSNSLKLNPRAWAPVIPALKMQAH